MINDIIIKCGSKMQEGKKGLQISTTTYHSEGNGPSYVASSEE